MAVTALLVCTPPATAHAARGSSLGHCLALWPQAQDAASRKLPWVGLSPPGLALLPADALSWSTSRPFLKEVPFKEWHDPSLLRTDFASLCLDKAK